MHFTLLLLFFQTLEICQKHLLVNDTDVLPSLNDTKIPQPQLGE